MSDRRKDELPDDEEAQYDGCLHRWTCPGCCSVNEVEDDPRGEWVTCDDCQESWRCQS